jgi:hypothetical protein
LDAKFPPAAKAQDSLFAKTSPVAKASPEMINLGNPSPKTSRFVDLFNAKHGTTKATSIFEGVSNVGTPSSKSKYAGLFEDNGQISYTNFFKENQEVDQGSNSGPSTKETGAIPKKLFADLFK